jgi:hypothetical protein
MRTAVCGRPWRPDANASAAAAGYFAERKQVPCCCPCCWFFYKESKRMRPDLQRKCSRSRVLCQSCPSTPLPHPLLIFIQRKQEPSARPPTLVQPQRGTLPNAPKYPAAATAVEFFQRQQEPAVRPKVQQQQGTLSNSTRYPAAASAARVSSGRVDFYIWIKK